MKTIRSVIKFYLSSDEKVIAMTSEGLYEYDPQEDLWFSVGFLYSLEDLNNMDEISEDDVNVIRKQNDSKQNENEASIYLERIAIRNEIGRRLSYDADYSFEENEYVNSIPIIHELMEDRVLEITQPVTFFVGENGTGKSTILEAIAVGFGMNGEGGDKYYDFETRKTYSELYRLMQLGRKRYPKDGFFLRAESFYNLATAIEDDLVKGYFGGKSLHKQSHGESFMSLIKSRFRGNGLYILDEPEAALSPMRVLELMKEIKRLVNQGSQFIIATHSPILMTYPDAQIFECTRTGINEKKYYELEGFKFIKGFLENPNYFLTEVGI